MGLSRRGTGSLSLLRYVSHPNVVVDPDVPVPQWGLSEQGRARLATMAGQPWLAATGRIICSPERKAREAAAIIAAPLGLDVEERPATGETDRSATGFVSHEHHEELADRYFAWPHESAEGWERSLDSQTRIVDALRDVWFEDDEVDTIVVGHGGVGTLLFCHLAGLTIDRTHDQPGQGHYWTFDRRAGRVLHGWLPIDEVISAG